jgi:hypothetical protein
MILLTEYFESQNTERQREYLICLQQNILNPLIEQIHLFISDESKVDIQSGKIIINKLEQRPTFFDIIKFCNEKLYGKPCIIANLDIFFDETLNHLLEFDLGDKLIALTRWDLVKENDNWFMSFYDQPWRNNYTTAMFSQDSWIFKSPVKIDERLNFPMGKPGCDNRISQIFHEMGYDVINPSKKIISKHYHQTNHRTYNVMDTVPGPYLLISPTENLTDKPNKFTIPYF